MDNEKTTNTPGLTSLSSNFMKGLPDLDLDHPGIPPKPEPPAQPQTSDGQTGQNSPPTVAGTTPNAVAEPGRPAAAAAPTTPNAAPAQKEPEKPASTQPNQQPPSQPGNPTDKAAEVKTESPGDAWPRNADDWKNYKKKHAEIESTLRKETELANQKATQLEAQLKELSAKQAEVKPSEPTPEQKLREAEFQRYKTERDEFEKKLIRLDVQSHPKFNAYYTGKIGGQIADVKAFLEPEKAKVAEEILRLDDGTYKNSRINEFLADLSPYESGEFMAANKAIRDIRRERQVEIDKGAAEREKYQSEQQAEQQKRQQAVESTFKSVAARFQDPKGGLAVFQVRDGDSDWNNGVLDRLTAAKNLIFGQNLGPNPAEKIAEAALQAVSFPVMVQYAKQQNEAHQAAIQAKDAEIEKLSQQVKQLTAVQPTAQTGAKAENTPAPLPTPRNPQEASRSFAQRLTESMQNWGS